METKPLEKTDVKLVEVKREEYRRRGFPPLISWWSKVASTHIGKELIINTLENYDNIYINGIKIIPPKLTPEGNEI